MRKQGGRHGWYGALAAAMVWSATASAVEARPLRTPRQGWERTDADSLPASILNNRSRAAAISVSVQDAPPDDTEIARLIALLAQQEGYRVTREWPRETLREGEIQRGFSFTIADGRRGFYAAIWRKRADRRTGVAAYVTLDTSVPERNVADFKMVRSLSNQILRGAQPGAPLRPAPQPQLPVAVAPDHVPGPAPTAIQPAADTRPATVALIPPPPAAATRPSTPGAGTSIGQIDSILYAPLESSDVFVLFKDGSFHETLPAAFEDWNIGASRSTEPDNWGKWKRAKENGEYEMRYGADDVVTIAARKIGPAPAGLKLEGRYAVDDQDDGESSARDRSIAFSGNRFVATTPQGEVTGQYRIDGYTIMLAQSDGRTERRPFFLIPPENADDDPAIWFGDELRVKQ